MASSSIKTGYSMSRRHLMQQMDQGETRGQWQKQSLYGNYEGEPRPAGQKLDSDDEQYAALLARKIKQELKDELGQGKNTGMRERMTLALSSVWAAATVFGMLVLALASKVSGDALYALGYGAVAAVVAIIAVN